MHIKLTSIVWEDIAVQVNELMVFLEDELSNAMTDRTYGGNVTCAFGVLVAISEDQNSRFAKPYNRTVGITGSDGRKTKQIGFAVEIDPRSLQGLSRGQLNKKIVQAFLARIGSGQFNAPAQFLSDEFARDLQNEIRRIGDQISEN